jgi:hypothetical protein
MTAIHSLKPNVSRHEALESFDHPARNLLFGSLRAVADFYIPFYLYAVSISNRGQQTSSIFGLDAVNGSLDLYRFDHLPLESELVALETRNCVPAALDEEAACEFVIAKVRRIVFSSGFFKLRSLRISAERQPRAIHVPYWVGFRGTNTAKAIILDAVRRKIEGPKVRHILHSWLLPSSEPVLVTPAIPKVLS